MQNLVKYIMAIAMIMTITQANAIDFNTTPLQGIKYRWSLGFDLDAQSMKAINDFSNLAFNHRQGSEIYIAYRTKGIWGFEGGYHWTTDKAKNFSTVPGTQLFGATAVTSAGYQCKMRIEDSYLDAYGHVRLWDIAELKLGIGAGFVRQNMRFYPPQALVANPNDPVYLAFTSMHTGTTITARFNIGLQTMLTKQIGARTLFNYQTTGAITAKYTLPTVDHHMFANSYMISIGLFYNVTGYYD